MKVVDRIMRLMLCLSFVFGAWLHYSSSASAQISTFLDDPFDSFTLGTTWQAHGDGAPEVELGQVHTFLVDYLSMASNTVGTETRGIETITSISLSGLTNITVDVRLRPINQGIDGSLTAAAVALLGSSGESLEGSASNNVGFGEGETQEFDWADFYEDSLGGSARTDSFAHNQVGASNAVDQYRRFLITVDDFIGTTFKILNDDESLNTTFTTSFKLSDLGSSLTIALRQDSVDGAVDPVFGFFDSILVTTDASHVLPADFDENGSVGSEDLALWQIGYGTPSDASHMDGDADADGVVDGADFLTWQRQLGLGTAVIAASAVIPEPSTFSLLGICALIGIFAGVRHRTCPLRVGATC